jgi:lipoprotein-anchoring transpeptidase ErfK/SrfK
MTRRKSLGVMAISGLCCLVILEILGFAVAFRSSGSPPATARNADPRYWESRVRALKARLAAMVPHGVYAIVDTASNVLTVKQGDRVVRTAVVSAGSGSMLGDPSGNRQWVFDTPRGVRSVQSKLEKPVWVRPDWAFIEEGEPVPSRYDERLDPGAMGDYAIGLGEGYFIHGTLYARLLGRNVTHGCVRVGDQDLKAIFNALSLGSRVILF